MTKLYRDESGTLVVISGLDTRYKQGSDTTWYLAERDLVEKAITSGRLKLLGNNYKRK